MYEKFFSLHKTPFAMVPDVDCLYLSGQHADVISGAVFGILERKGCIALTGEAGLGKTTAIRAAVDLLNESNAHTSLIFHPTLNGSEFLELAMLNFGIQSVPKSKAQRLKLLEEFLLAADASDRVCTLIVDEAHKLGPEALEEVRLLGNFERGNRKLLQILLAGQNELVDRLNLPELWQLKQRIAFRLSLKRMDRDGVERYVRFRWAKAGGDDNRLPFNEVALDAIALWSKGIPRVINAVCDNSLLLAFSETSQTVGLSHVQEACGELDLEMEPLHAKTPTQPSSGRGPQPIRPDVAVSEPPVVARPVAQIDPATQTGPAPQTHPVTPVRKVTPVTNHKPHKPVDARGTPSAWAESKPSLLKKWLGFSETPKPSAAQDPLSLKRRP